ncbi:MAG: serine hydrolase [Lachnospiraceae bacterium]|nr:serine hydrolase [Lachnospiraceae bacterium]
MAIETEQEELERIQRRKARMQQMRLEKEQAIRRQKLVKKLAPAVLVALVLLIGGITLIVQGVLDTRNGQNQAGMSSGEHTIGMVKAAEAENEIDRDGRAPSSGDENAEGTDPVGTGDGEGLSDSANPSNSQQTISTKRYSAQETEITSAPPSGVDSTNVIFLQKESGEILAARNCHTVINPASMTKVLTILVAAEHIDMADLDDTFTITLDITDYSYVHDCSNAGFEKDEKVTVRDLFYGTILPSGADAAVGLATYVAGSHEAFVDLMNEKLEILGLSDTAHFTNCVGIYDKDHHCTVYDMAMIMEAALDNEFCREVLGAHTYTTSSTEAHPDGMLLSNWFLRRIEDRDTGGEVLCGKTGFVDQSGNCAVSFGMDESGNEYICATTGAQGSMRCVNEHAALYKAYAKRNNTAE